MLAVQNFSVGPVLSNAVSKGLVTGVDIQALYNKLTTPLDTANIRNMLQYMKQSLQDIQDSAGKLEISLGLVNGGGRVRQDANHLPISFEYPLIEQLIPYWLLNLNLFELGQFEVYSKVCALL